MRVTRQMKRDKDTLINIISSIQFEELEDIQAKIINTLIRNKSIV